jgi:hypothetical protein
MKNMKRFLPAVVGVSTFLSMSLTCIDSDEHEKEYRPEKACSSSSYVEPIIPGLAAHPFYQSLFQSWSPEISLKFKVSASQILRAKQIGAYEYGLHLFLINSFESDARGGTTDQHLGLVELEKALLNKTPHTINYAIRFAATLSVMGTTDYPGMLKLFKAASKVPATYGLCDPMPLREIIMETVLRAVPGDDFHGNHQKQHAKRAKLIKKTLKTHTARVTDSILTIYANMDSKVFYDKMMAAQKEKESMTSSILSSPSTTEKKERRASPRANSSSPLFSSPSKVLQEESTTRAISTHSMSEAPTITVPVDSQENDMPGLTCVEDEKTIVSDEKSKS